MKKSKYIAEFEKLGFGLFVHFGLYSIVGKGEWYFDLNPAADKNEYEQLTKKFNVNKNWAKNLARTAKAAGCKYITLTTRHHDGFSLYDTCGLNDYDAHHSACGRGIENGRWQRSGIGYEYRTRNEMARDVCVHCKIAR